MIVREGISLDKEKFKFNYNEDYNDDILKLKYQAYNKKFSSLKGVDTYIGYKYNKNAKKDELKKFIYDIKKLENFCKAPSTIFATYNFSHSLSKIKVVDDNDLIFSSADTSMFNSVKTAVPGKPYLNPENNKTPENPKYVKHEVEEGKEVEKYTNPVGEQIIEVVN